MRGRGSPIAPFYTRAIRDKRLVRLARLVVTPLQTLQRFLIGLELLFLFLERSAHVSRCAHRFDIQRQIAQRRAPGLNLSLRCLQLGFDALEPYIELAGQIGDGPVQIVTAVGSCGTFAGLNLGARLFLPRARVIGISVSRTAREIVERTVELVRDSAQLLGIETPMSAADLECYDAYVGEYGVPTPAGQDAIRTAAQTEGLLLDPVYTGKSMSGLLDLAHRRVLDPAVPTVFLHTGGLPIVFAFEDAIREQAACTKIRR